MKTRISQVDSEIERIAPVLACFVEVPAQTAERLARELTLILMFEDLVSERTN